MRKANLSIVINVAWTWLSHITKFAHCSFVFRLFMHNFGKCSRNDRQVNNLLALFAFAFDSEPEILINTENAK